MSTYVDDFLSLKCAGDVINACAPLRNGAKEISESMAMIRAMRDVVLAHKTEYELYDLCAGNALTSVLAVHLLPIARAIAIDKRPRVRHWEDVERFEYRSGDVHTMMMTGLNPHIIIGVHACGNLAEHIIRLYLHTHSARHLYLMPCCIDHDFDGEFSQVERARLSKYERWCLHLARLAGTTDVRRDDRRMSPCNIIIAAHKEP